jgi:hypothetical protein
MLDNLKFNICKLESSHLANSNVPDSKSRIAKYIPPCSIVCLHLLGRPFRTRLFRANSLEASIPARDEVFVLVGSSERQ